MVPQVSADFDRYWASGSAYPVASLLPAARPGALDRLTEAAALVAQRVDAEPYVAALKQSSFIKQLECEVAQTVRKAPAAPQSDRVDGMAGAQIDFPPWIRLVLFRVRLATLAPFRVLVAIKGPFWYAAVGCGCAMKMIL